MPSWSRRRRPARRTAITDPDPADEVVRMRRLVTDLNGVVEDLWLQVRPLRAELAASRGNRIRTSWVDEWPPVRPLPREADDPRDEAPVLDVLFEDLHVVSESLWMELQWLRAQLASRAGA